MKTPAHDRSDRAGCLGILPNPLPYASYHPTWWLRRHALAKWSHIGRVMHSSRCHLNPARCPAGVRTLETAPHASSCGQGVRPAGWREDLGSAGMHACLQHMFVHLLARAIVRAKMLGVLRGRCSPPAIAACLSVCAWQACAVAWAAPARPLLAQAEACSWVRAGARGQLAWVHATVTACMHLPSCSGTLKYFLFSRKTHMQASCNLQSALLQCCMCSAIDVYCRDCQWVGCKISTYCVLILPRDYIFNERGRGEMIDILILRKT